MGKVIISGVGGSGVGSDECTATKDEVLKGYGAITKDSDDEVIQGTLELTGNAADSHVLAEKTYYNKDAKAKRTGAMPNRGAVNTTLNAGGSYTIPAGYHNGGGKVTANSLASQTPGNASAGNILSGKSAWVNGQKVAGKIASMGGQTIIPNAYSHTLSCSGKYMTGNVYVPAVSNLSAGNIKKGVRVGGVLGTHSGYVPSATDLYLRGNAIVPFQGSYSVRFDTGQVSLVGKYGVEYFGFEQFNFAGYNHFNLEGYYTGGISGYTKEIVLSDATRNNHVRVGSVVFPDNFDTGNFNCSFDISAYQSSFKARVSFHNFRASAIYHVWLS